METLLKLADQRPAYWADDVIKTWDEDEFQRMKPFAVSSYWGDSASLNIFQVIGTDHPDYQGQPWGWFIRHGKRMNLNLPLHASNRKYYLETDRKKEPPMFYISTNGHEWYVYGDGNHRTCIARFDFHYHGLTELHGLTIEDWRFDYGMAQVYERLMEIIAERRLPYALKVSRKTVKRDDNPGWQREEYRPLIMLRGGGKDICMDRAGGVRLARYFESPWYRRMFRAWPGVEHV